ncbi:MAG: cache domain-containing protein, partial [Ktedonobacterales bacterium]
MFSRIAIRGWLSRRKRSAALRFVRRSLLVQLLGVYLVFVLLVIGSGLEADAVGQSQIRDGFQSTDLTLAQEVSFDTYSTLDTIEQSLVELGQTAATYVTSGRDMTDLFSVYEIARLPDIDRVYWLDAAGALRLSVPPAVSSQGANFSNSAIFHLAASSNDPVVLGGAIDPATHNAVVTIAEPVRDNRGAFLGVLATSLLLDGLSTPLHMVIAAQTTQTTQGQHLEISVLDNQGKLIASPDSAQLLQPLANTLPGAASALAGNSVTSEARGPDGADWLYTAVPVPALGWAVVVQRPTSEIAQATSDFRIWLLLATGLFALGGLLFWIVLLRRVVRPLHTLAGEHSQLPPVGPVRISTLPVLTGREDEIGKLSRSLQRLQHDVAVQLSELRTLLETSNAVVNSLDPRSVGATIIREVRRLVDVQAAAVHVPDEEGTLRVLVSEGRAEDYGDLVHIRPDNMAVPSARAFHERRPVQMIDDG